MDAIQGMYAGAKGFVGEQIAAKAFNKREAIMQGVNLGGRPAFRLPVWLAASGVHRAHAAHFKPCFSSI